MNDYLFGLVSGFTTAIILVVSLLAHMFLRFGPPTPTTTATSINISLTRPTKRPTTTSTPHNPNPRHHETLHWLNNLLTRLVNDVASSDYTRQVLQSRLEQLLNNSVVDGASGFLEPVVVEDVCIGWPCRFKTIYSTESEVELSVEWSADGAEPDADVLSVSLSSAVGYKGLVALPFKAVLSLKRVALTARLELHTHYLRLGFHNTQNTQDDPFQLAFNLNTELGHLNTIKDSFAIRDFVKSVITRHIKRTFIDDDLVVPYAAFMTMIPRVLSPPMSPKIAAEDLFATTDDLSRPPGLL